MNALSSPVLADSSLLEGLEEVVKMEVTSGTAGGERVEEGLKVAGAEEGI